MSGLTRIYLPTYLPTQSRQRYTADMPDHPSLYAVLYFSRFYPVCCRRRGTSRTVSRVPAGRRREQSSFGNTAPAIEKD